MTMLNFYAGVTNGQSQSSAIFIYGRQIMGIIGAAGSVPGARPTGFMWPENLI